MPPPLALHPTPGWREEDAKKCTSGPSSYSRREGRGWRCSTKGHVSAHVATLHAAAHHGCGHAEATAALVHVRSGGGVQAASPHGLQGTELLRLHGLRGIELLALLGLHEAELGRSAHDGLARLLRGGLDLG